MEDKAAFFAGCVLGGLIAGGRSGMAGESLYAAAWKVGREMAEAEGPQSGGDGIPKGDLGNEVKNTESAKGDLLGEEMVFPAKGPRRKGK